jgi:hypothetical protein
MGLYLVFAAVFTCATPNTADCAGKCQHEGTVSGLVAETNCEMAQSCTLTLTRFQRCEERAPSSVCAMLFEPGSSRP